MAGFDLSNGKSTNNAKSIIGFSQECTQKLYSAVRKCTTKPFSTNRWASYFDMLQLDAPKEEIEEVLGWYVLHIKANGIPEALSARAFKRKYRLIKEAMALDPAKARLSDTAQDLLPKILNLGWPGSPDIYLPSLIQRSLDNYIAFYDQARAWHESLSYVSKANGYPEILLKDRKELDHTTQLVWRFLDALLQERWLTGPSEFIYCWFGEINEPLQNWPDWNGNPQTFLFTAGCARFLKLGRSRAYKYCGDSIVWDRMVEHVR